MVTNCGLFFLFFILKKSERIRKGHNLTSVRIKVPLLIDISMAPNHSLRPVPVDCRFQIDLHHKILCLASHLLCSVPDGESYFELSLNFCVHQLI